MDAPDFALAAASQPAPRTLHRLGGIMCLAVAIGAAFAGGGLAWVWFSPEDVATLLAPRLGLAGIPLALDGWSRLAGFLTSMVPLLVLFYALYQVYLLCSGIRRGEMFSAGVGLRLRRIGAAMLATAALRPLTGAVLSVLLTAGNGPGARHLVLNISSDDYMIAAFGGLILMIGHVMAEAARIAEENRQIV